MNNKTLKIPAIIIAIGLITAIVAYFLTSVQLKPTVTEQDFAYSVTYKIDGETKTFDGIYTCRFDGFGNDGVDPLFRYYTGEYTVDRVQLSSRCYTIDEKDGYELYIVTLLEDDQLMGDNQDPIGGLQDPCLEAKDADGNQYDQEALPSVFDAEIVSWKYPEPIENSFVFAGFSGLYVGNMSWMMLVGLLTLICCMIFVKKGEGVVYSTLDKIGIVLNFLIVFAALPISYLIAGLIQAYPTGPDWIYQGYLCIPPMISFTLAASVSLRRKGFRKCGFFVQFLGFGVSTILAIVEYLL